jgi:ubiquinone/menaquinone biosynthesis C-methylase UbiE
MQDKIQDKIIDLILKINKKYFFKKSHPFNKSKEGVLNLNYSDFEYEHTKELLKMYNNLGPVPFKGTSPRLQVLEVWCGWWWKSVYIAEKYNCEVIWIDIEDNFLNQARQFSRQKKVDNLVHFYKKSALNTGFNNGQFDVIIMSAVLEHIPETDKLLNEMWRILKKDWIILFDFASYYHYFGHHLWDTIQIPWIHLFFSDKFLIKLYKKSVKDLVDWDARVKLRIWYNEKEDEVFDYLNKISRKKFEKVMWRFVKKNRIKDFKIKYYMLKKMSFLDYIPGLREIFIKHIVWYIKK